MSASERNPCISTKKEMEPREPVVTYNGEDRSEATLRAVVGACFLCLRYFETIPYSEPRFMPPLRGSHLFLWGGSRDLGLRVFALYALTGRPSRGSTAGLLYSAPPGLKFRLPSSLLRSYAEAGAGARKLSYTPPSTSHLSITVSTRNTQEVPSACYYYCKSVEIC